MSKLSHAYGSWMSGIVATLGVALDHTHTHMQGVGLPDEIPGVGKLSRDACALPGLFSRARSLPALDSSAAGAPVYDQVHAFAVPQRAEQSRAEAFIRLDETLQSCRCALAECRPHLSLTCRRRLEDAVRTLETEYVRLCDAERFLSARRLRQARIGEADDDPEFTVVLERVVYASDQGDDVASSVAQAVQTIVAELLPYVARPE
jgi:hypothetical protein